LILIYELDALILADPETSLPAEGWFKVTVLRFEELNNLLLRDIVVQVAFLDKTPKRTSSDVTV